MKPGWNTKHLGRLQKCILEEIYGPQGKRMLPATSGNLQKDVQEAYWGDVIEERGPELNRRRAAISRALHMLELRGLIGKGFDMWYIEDRETFFKIREKKR